MNSSTDTRSTMEDCPALEDLAAFLDGTLPAEERERIVAHLADCETCYEVFAGAAHFQVESAEPRGGVVPFPFEDKKEALQDKEAAAQVFPFKHEKPSAAPWWLAAAAAVLLVPSLALIYFLLTQPQTLTAELVNFYRRLFQVDPQVQPQIVITELVEPVQGKPEVTAHLYDYSRSRGAEEEFGEVAFFSDRPSFMVGVFITDLWLSAKAGDVERSAGLLQGIGIKLEDFLHATDIQTNYYDEYRQLLYAPESEAAGILQKISEDIPARERQLEELSQSSSAFAFGKWAEAGRLAADLREPEFFETRKNWRFLLWLLRQDEADEDRPDEEVIPLLRRIKTLWYTAEPDPEVRSFLEKIGNSLDKDEFQPSDYEALEKSFEAIIRHYDA